MEFDNKDLVKKICRTCLRIDSDENLCYLFSKEEADGEIPVPDMISECTTFPIKEGDGYPNQICRTCIEQVKTAYVFRKTCEKSYQILTSIIQKCRTDTDESSHFLESIFVSELHCLKTEEEAGTQAEVLLLYPCDKCEAKFFSVEILKNHMKEKHEKIKCRICSKECKSSQEKATESSSDSEFVLNENGVCNSCSDFYSQSDDLNNYVESEDNKDGSDIPWQYLCAVCNRTFSSEDTLKHHVCEENCDTSIKSEKSAHLSSLGEPENPLGEVENFHLTGTLLNSDTESFGVDNDFQGGYSSGDDGRPLSELQGKAESSGGKTKNKRGKKNKKVKKRNTHQCDICHKVFSRSTHLRRHALTHSNEKPFACKVCNKGFTRMDHLNVHMHHHSDTKPHVCDICERGFTRAEHLRKHKEARHGNKMKTPKTEFCDICKKGFTTVKYLHIHMRSHTDRIWSCKTCPEKFKTKPELTAHMKIHAASEKPFLCSECGLRFVRNDYLVIHMRRHKGEKPYKCKFCSKGFPRATDLTVHERYHTGEKTHLCTICGKGFQRAYNLLVHMRVHTGERPYQCPHCTKRFAQGNDLKAHIRRHTGERFKCDICGDGFIQGYHLTQHKRNAHGIDMKSHIRRVEKFVTPVEQQKQVEALQSNQDDQQDEGTPIYLSPRSDNDKREEIEEVECTLTEVEVIKIEDDNMDGISLSAEQAELLESGQEITVVDGDNVTMISYFNPPSKNNKSDATSE